MKSRTFLLFALLLISCKKDWIEAKADKKTSVPATVGDFQAMLDDAATMNLASSTTISEVSADGHHITEDVWKQYMGTINQNKYTWSNAVPYNILYDWNSAYSAILSINIILAEAGKHKITENGIAQIKAQALFHRGRIFLDLAGVFSPAYNTNTASTDLGIPLRLSDDVTEPSVRATVEKTYDQIIDDIKNAVNDLPTDAAYITRASKPAALALLSRAYLCKGDFINAAKAADQCLALKSRLLNYGTIPSSNTFIGINSEVLFLSLLPAGDELTNEYLIDNSLYDLYDDNDLRKSTFFTIGSMGIQFKGSYANSVFDLFSGIALDEVYLIRAECYARAGDLTSAMKALNDLVRTRYAKKVDGTSSYIDRTSSSEEDALRKIFVERKKQLILRNLRWIDLKRLNLDPRFAVTITRTIGGQTYILEPNSYKYTFPIANDIMQKSNIQQNPGWK